MKKILMSAAALLVLAGCANQQAPMASSNTQASNTTPVASNNVQLAVVTDIDGTVEVNYTCNSPEGPKKIGVMYGIKDNTLVLAQMKIGSELTPGLYRVLNDEQGDRQNSYYGEGLTWITAKATPNTAKTTQGNMLMQANTLNNQGFPSGTQDVLLRSCRVNS